MQLMTNVRRTDDKKQIFIVCLYLTMFFRAGKYLYKNVDEKTFEDFSEADSKGKFLNEVLKKDFKVERL